jgi:two-component system nitrogen regulation sensor histidine kinase GlnL
MIEFYFYIFAFSALECVLLSGILVKRNWGRTEGWLGGVALLVMGFWLFGLGHYFLPLDDEQAFMWARATLTAAMLIPAFYLHAMCVMANIEQSQRRAILIAYGVGVVLTALIWSDLMGLKIVPQTFLHHYVHLKPWYPLLMVQIVGLPIYTVWLMVRTVRQLAGYKRLQIYYLIFITVAIHLTTTTVLIPMQFGIHLPPYGVILLPFELALLGYAFVRVRLMDFSQATSKVLLYTVTLVMAILVGLVPIWITGFVNPEFLNQAQIFFVLWLVTLVGFGVALMVPRLSPYLEETVRGRFFSQQYRYQQSMMDVIGKLSAVADIQSMLDNVVDAVLQYVGVTRVSIYLEDDVTGVFVARAWNPPKGLPPKVRELLPSSALIKQLKSRPHAILKEELARSTSFPRGQTESIMEELQQLGATMAVPLIHKNWLVGILTTSSRSSGEMFSAMDIELLESLGREMAIAVHHRKMENQIMKSERLITLGTVAAGIAHEIRNPLASIGTFAALMNEKGSDASFRDEFGRVVAADVERINNVINTVLAFSRPANVDTKPHNLAEIVEQSLVLLKPSMKDKNVPIELAVQHVPQVRINPQQIVQVLLNLIKNAVDAVPAQSGKVMVSVYVLITNADRKNSETPHYVVVEVSDNGPGVPENILQQLFQPFFTTKKGGTGLGLAISQKIASDHGGFITAENRATQGAVFRLHLPIADSE